MSLLQNRFFSIRVRLISLVAATAIPLVAVGANFAVNELAQDRSESMRQLGALALASAARLDDQVNVVTDMLRVLSHSISVDDGSIETNDRVLQDILAEMPSYYSGISVYGSDGRNLGFAPALTQDRASLNVRDRDYFLAIQGGADVAVSQVLTSRVSNRTVVAVARPIRDRSSRAISGVLAVSLSLERLGRIFDSLDVPPGVVVQIVNERGIVLARSASGESWIGKDLSGDPWLARHLGAGGISEDVVWADGESRLTTSVRATQVPWLVSTGISTKIAEADLERAAWRSGIVGGGAIALALLAAWMISGRISAPLRQLQEDTRKLVGSDFRHRSDVRSRSEIGQLSASFNAMAEQLSDEVAKRTRVEQTASAIIEQSPFAIIGVHPDRRVMLWNQAAERIFGYAAAEVVGKTYALVPAEGQAEFDRIIERVSAGERLVDIEVRRLRKDGALVDIVFSGAPLYDPEHRLTGLVFVLQDVTERKAIEAQLRQSQKMEAIGQLSGGIAHDFNNMLGAIIGNLEIALDEQRDIAQIHKLVDVAIGIAVRGGELVQRLLAFARRQMLVPRLLDVTTVIDGVVPILRRTLGEAIEIMSRCEPGLWPVLVDASQLDSALLNLAINARDAMPRGGALTITAGNVTVDADMAPIYPDLKPGDYVVIAVADTGSGMPPEVAARAFEPFYTTKETGKGTGLGLSMVYGFLRQSGGTAKIYSEVGHGTTVHLYLPRADSQAAGAPAADAVKAAPGGRERVLVVEDNPDMRDVACSMLTGLGYQVTAAGDAAQALGLIASEAPFDLLFSDVVMPGISGIELAETVRRSHPAMKILLTSGFASPVAVRDQAKAAGIELLAKPYRRIALAVKVREVLDRGA